ncbi:hypothetical protein EV356DRAFT_37961 [Viridothelium virens]|uniref:Uncharacterized protein n=1 Tax=Viridothelium virens TaxID=1048519 RepID=A0A6A6HGE9_VIRVR|nr:hypothetical protein EV356DRAFT_37961 [Viridothelium virens]
MNQRKPVFLQSWNAADSRALITLFGVFLSFPICSHTRNVISHSAHILISSFHSRPTSNFFQISGRFPNQIAGGTPFYAGVGNLRELHQAALLQHLPLGEYHLGSDIDHLGSANHTSFAGANADPLLRDGSLAQSATSSYSLPPSNEARYLPHRTAAANGVAWARRR